MESNERMQKYVIEKEKEISALQAFKDYVHKRLDDAGIAKDPESPHKKAGCRIGGRLDIVLKQFEQPVEPVKETQEDKFRKVLSQIRWIMNYRTTWDEQYMEIDKVLNEIGFRFNPED